jgi:hypothetical protein
MRVTIENYRGIEIEFDTEQESFLAAVADTGVKKSSFTSIKKAIDDYFKNNLTFPAFHIERTIDSYYPNEIRRIVGIRKDGRFVAETSKGTREQVSEYDERNWIVRNPDNDPVRAEISKLDVEIRNLETKKRELSARILSKTLKEIKQNYLQFTKSE